MESAHLNFAGILLTFEPTPPKTNSHFTASTCIFTQEDHMCGKKVLLDKGTMQIMPTLVKGRHSIDAEMNAESFEYSYFRQTVTVFVVQVKTVRC